MKRWILIIAITTTALSTFGCSMCCGPYDYDYPNFGGKHERVNPAYGRVGSVFSDPNAGFNGPSADSNLEPQPDIRVNKESPRDDDPDLEQLKRELDSELESIDPINGPERGSEELPSPDADDSTASRMWRNKPLRSNQTWR